MNPLVSQHNCLTNSRICLLLALRFVLSLMLGEFLWKIEIDQIGVRPVPAPISSYNAAPYPLVLASR